MSPRVASAAAATLLPLRRAAARRLSALSGRTAWAFITTPCCCGDAPVSTVAQAARGQGVGRA